MQPVRRAFGLNGHLVEVPHASCKAGCTGCKHFLLSLPMRQSPVASEAEWGQAESQGVQEPPLRGLLPGLDLDLLLATPPSQGYLRGVMETVHCSGFPGAEDKGQSTCRSGYKWHKLRCHCGVLSPGQAPGVQRTAASCHGGAGLYTLHLGSYNNLQDRFSSSFYRRGN